MTEMGNAFYRAYIAHEKINRYAKLIDNPDCVKEVLNKDYWDAEKYLTSEDDAESPIKYYILIAIAGVVLIIALALFTLWYCKKRKTSTIDMLTNESARDDLEDI